MELQQHQNETIAVLEDRRTAADGFAALRLGRVDSYLIQSRVAAMATTAK
ncbi:hypothetical protein AAFX91_41640 [Bradyrhizobium sp. 31Argb]